MTPNPTPAQGASTSTANDDRHRVVRYAVVQLGGQAFGAESGGAEIGLESYTPVPSMCCCPSDWPDC